MNIKVDISVGELFDKISILEIKKERIKEKEKLEKVNQELNLLKTASASFQENDSLKRINEDLKKTNEKLWEIEDEIRKLELRKEFGKEFIHLARSVYITNDTRSELKRKINHLLGSTIEEVKSYQPYQ